MTRENEELLFVLFGMVWCGIVMFGLAVAAGLRSVFIPKPKLTQWEKEWEDIERRISK